jgi:UPF0755 protein
LLLGIALTLVACGSEPLGEPVRFVVPRGATLRIVADSLAARGFIGERTRPIFRAYARLRGADREVRAGQYELLPGASWSALLETLTEGRAITERMTIPEGFVLRQIAPRIAAVTGISPDSALAVLLRPDTIVEGIQVPGPNLEGYLFPDTYLFEPGTSIDRVIVAMVERYRSFWTTERRQRLAALEMTEREVVTLASIIQAEALWSREMPVISGVYHNRLRVGFPLQADPTVLYALGGPRERLLYAAIDSVADNPYNTYRRAGLPPGPIGSPGELAMEAALNPADTPHFYFVAGPDGTHVFTTTLAEHNVAKAQARRAWDTARSAARTRGAELESVPQPGRRPPP